MPRFSAFVTKWDLSPDVSDAMFAFEPPAGAVRIDLTSSDDAHDTEGGGE